MNLFFLTAAQERWRPLLQLHGSSHPLLRETGSTHSSRVQYPFTVCERQTVDASHPRGLDDQTRPRLRFFNRALRNLQRRGAVQGGQHARRVHRRHRWKQSLHALSICTSAFTFILT